jgi:hypothetical protein
MASTNSTLVLQQTLLRVGQSIIEVSRDLKTGVKCYQFLVNEQGRLLQMLKDASSAQ